MKAAPHILVIDDENHICESCNRIFSNAGYVVDTTINATSGFRQALTNPYDAIILDLNLVEADGMKLLYGIRKRKPGVPVVIITGYPSEDTRRTSTTLGVRDYIEKPFEPAEILEPVQRIISAERGYPDTEKTIAGDEISEHCYHFYHSSWFYRLAHGMVRVGAYLPNLSNCYIKSIKLPELESVVYRGLPLAEVTMSNGSKQIIPSPVNGKVTVINNQLRDHFYNLERNIHTKNWIAVVEPYQLEQDINSCETRKILVLAGDGSEENEFFKKFVHKGYRTRITGNIGTAVKILSEEPTKVLVLDAENLGDSGPGYVQRINQEFPDVRIIVFNEPDVNFERSYRKNNIFYYGVNPISNNEMIDLLHSAFTEDNRKISLKNPHVSRFLPSTISKISTTNRHGIKVTLFAYNEILQNSGGLGYLLTKDLLDMAFPMEVHHSRFRRSAEETPEYPDNSRAIEENDRIIILLPRDFNAIPGSILKEIKEYPNKNSTLNLLIHIFIQPREKETGSMEFDANTTMTLKDIILNEMISG